MLTTCSDAKAANVRMATSSPLNPPHMPSALPLGLLMSLAEEKPVQAGSPKLSSVELARKVEPLPLVEPAQTVVLAGCEEMLGATSTFTVTMACAVQPTESVAVTV